MAWGSQSFPNEETSQRRLLKQRALRARCPIALATMGVPASHSHPRQQFARGFGCDRHRERSIRHRGHDDDVYDGERGIASPVALRTAWRFVFPTHVFEDSAAPKRPARSMSDPLVFKALSSLLVVPKNLRWIEAPDPIQRPEDRTGCRGEQSQDRKRIGCRVGAAQTNN